jgi:hypothetical protein
VLITSAGLTAGPRVEAGFGTRYAEEGHYAVFSINRRGRVVYAFVPKAGSDGMKLFDPQTNKPINWHDLGPRPIARRYTVRA